MPDKKKQSFITLTGSITHTFYTSPSFSAGIFVTNANEEIKFAGNLFAKEHVPIILHGQWGRHPKYGRQFKVQSIEFDLDFDLEGLTNFLATHPDFKGIGPVKAKRIVETCGTNFEKMLLQAPATIASIAKISIKKVEQIRKVWLKTKSTNKALSFLASFDITHHQRMSIIDKLGNNAITILKENPYIISKQVSGLGFKRIDQIALKMGIQKEKPARIRAGLCHCLEEALDAGDCWVEERELIDRCNTLLIMDCLDSRDRIETELDGLVVEGVLISYPYDNRSLIAKPDINQMEVDLAKIFSTGHQTNPHFADIDDLESLVEHTHPNLNKEQAQAVITALTYKMSLISGGAGSGKTYTAAAITALYQKTNLQVILAAPTGKAAKRLEQVIDHPAGTIHRLLGYNGRNYSKGPDDPIQADVILLDEVSMVDIYLAWHLFQAIDLNHTSVVLLGDHNQLPPIGPGNILRDLINSRVIPATILDKVVRHAGVLKENCMALLSGQVRKTATPELNGKRSWYLIDKYKDQLNAREAIVKLYQTILYERLEYDLLKDVQLLTPTHKGPLGTLALNIALQKLIQKKVWQRDVPDTPVGRRPKLYRHDKVIQTRNNYDLGIMNGSMGIIAEIEDNGDLIIMFENGPVTIEAETENRRYIQLAYALSCHRSQGSEFPCTIVVIHKSHSFMHHRNLFYTGVTRAKKTAIIIGDHWGVRNCAEKRNVENRNTFLSFLLGKTEGP